MINMKLATTSYIPRHEKIVRGKKMTLDAKVKNPTIVINDNSQLSNTVDVI